MQEEHSDDLIYEDNQFSAILFFEVSQNRQLLIGKLTLTPKVAIDSFPMLIHIKGLYQVTSEQQQNSREDSQVQLTQSSNPDFLQTINNIDAEETKRVEKKQILNMRNNPDMYQLSQYFLEGKQKVSQIGANEVFQAWKSIVFPFNFSLPSDLPPTLDAIHFADKDIQIKYFIICECLSQNKSNNHKISFQITIPQKISDYKKSSQLCRSIDYRCFKPFFCGCLGIYHLQIVGSVLSQGKLQVEARIYKDNKRTRKFVDKLTVMLYSQLKNVKKVMMDKKQIFLHENEFQMLSGQVLLTYDKKLKSYANSLFEIRFWVQLKMQFSKNVWTFVIKDEISDIKL